MSRRGTAGTGAYFANSAPVVRRVPVTLPGLAPALDGLRIVTFSDGHLSAMSSARRFERLVELVNEQQPDVERRTVDAVRAGARQNQVEPVTWSRGPAAPVRSLIPSGSRGRAAA